MKIGQFTGNQKPTRDGVYRRNIGGCRLWSRWLLGRWRTGSKYFDTAACATDGSLLQSIPWEAIIK